MFGEVFREFVWGVWEVFGECLGSVWGVFGECLGIRFVFFKSTVIIPY